MCAEQTTELEDCLGLLSARSRSPEIPESADVYGWLVGSWDLEVLHYRAIDLRSRNIQGEAHFGWVLEAIKDVWIMPNFGHRNSDTDRANNMYGTTLRLWDPDIQAWRIRWMNPVNGQEECQTGRKVGKDIVQIGARLDGTPTRWRFTETKIGFVSLDRRSLGSGRSTWKLEGEFRGRRR
jgi:hypothetical protein